MNVNRRGDNGNMPKPLPVLVDPGPVCCDPIGSSVLSESDAVGLAVRLKALADPVRLRLVDHLVRAGEAATFELAPVVGLGESTTSHHLQQLHRAGLVVKRREGPNVYYRLETAAIAALVAALGCCS